MHFNDQNTIEAKMYILMYYVTKMNDSIYTYIM